MLQKNKECKYRERKQRKRFDIYISAIYFGTVISILNLAPLYFYIYRNARFRACKISSHSAHTEKTTTEATKHKHLELTLLIAVVQSKAQKT